VNRDDDGGFWLITTVIAVGAVILLHAYSGANPQVPTPPAAIPTASNLDRASPSEPGPTAPSRPLNAAGVPIIATVFECQERGHHIFSDQRCGRSAQVRSVEAPNSMDPQDTSAMEPSAAGLDLTSRANPRNPAVPIDFKSPQCRAIQQEKERIDTRMREGYGAAEGERLRERLRALNDEYYELRCHHVRD
jgi:hypothetical protein